MERWKIEPLGDRAVIVRLPKSRSAPAEALPRLLAVQRQLQNAAIAGVTEVATAYATVAVFYDPAIMHEHITSTESAFDWLKQQLASVLARRPRRQSKLPARRIDIPVCYAAEFALDLAEVATRTELPQAEVVRRYSAADYRVQCIGFTPGFPYLEGLPTELATRRRANPRTQVPAGSVAIGGGQAGIYPLASPGGWNVIGRTPLKLFAAEREQPALLQAGDYVRFLPISVEEFHAFDSSLQSTANK